MSKEPVLNTPPRSVGNIRRFLVAAEDLPSPKGTALHLMEITRSPDASLSEAVRVVRSDPALAAFVLRAANTARFGFRPVLLDLNQAVARLGLDVVRSHAMALSMMSEKPRSLCEAFDYRMFWIRSLATGVAMEHLTSLLPGLPLTEAFSLGLLAHIGQLAFATSAPREYHSIASRLDEGLSDEEISFLERETFGFDHHELSAVLLVDWGIPTSMADVVYWQCDPEGSGCAPDSLQYRLASALQLASRLAACLVPNPYAEERSSVLFLRAAINGLSTLQVYDWAKQTHQELIEWMRLLRMEHFATVILPVGLRQD
jgi:HD-like signal output (HDOD) protein